MVTKDDWIFSVVRYELPDSVKNNKARAFLRYIPDKNGDRVLKLRRCFDNSTFRKVGFEEGYEFLKKKKREYIEEFSDAHLVPKRDIKDVLHPAEEMERIAELDERVRKVYDFLREEANIEKRSIGVTGSFLCGLQNEKSDIDFVIYGRKNFDRAREAIKEKREFEIDEKTWRRIYNKRMPELSYEEFLAHEKRKNNRGMIGNTYFDVLYVRNWEEVAKIRRRDIEKGRVLGTAVIRGEVRDAVFSFDSPAIYGIEHDFVEKIICWTHTYAGQALEGEEIEAKGVLEEIDGEKRLIVGTRRDSRGEWIRAIFDDGEVRKM